MNTEGNKSEAPKKEKYHPCISCRMPAMAVKEEENRYRREKGTGTSTNGGQRSAGANIKEMVSPVSRETVRVVRNRTQGGRPAGNRPEGRRDGNRDGRTFEERRRRKSFLETVPRMVRTSGKTGRGNRGTRQNDGRGGSRFGGGANRGQGGQAGSFEGRRDGGNRFGGGANQWGQGEARADVPEGGRSGDKRSSGAAKPGGQGGGQRPGQRSSGGSSDAVFTRS